MAGSYRQVNYSLRPAKAIERKMLCEAFRRLYPFSRIETYRYVGFGSIYFSDFHLFHRALGMRDMLSIEKDAYAKDCFEFNKPYNCVRVDCRPASEVLPGLDWGPKTIAWLDYDGKLDKTVLSDIKTVCTRASSGSMLVVSVNAQVEHDPDESGRQQFTAETGMPYDLDEYRLRELRSRIEDIVPPEVVGGELRGKGLARVSRRLIQSTIAETLSARNAGMSADKRMIYRQLFNLTYSDGAMILTVGGVIYEVNEQPRFDACSFGELTFVRFEDDFYDIDVPCLTIKEMRHLNGQLPQAAEGSVSLPGVPPSDITRYAELYRYFPTFTEAVLT